jgi:hypothetical protein
MFQPQAFLHYGKPPLKGFRQARVLSSKALCILQLMLRSSSFDKGEGLINFSLRIN